MENLWVLAVSLVVVLVGLVVGSITEKRHLASIRRREQELLGVVTTTLEEAPPDWRVGHSQLVTGSVVISLDAFKRMVAGLKTIVGGRIVTYEPLLDRARREAVLRLKQQTSDLGCDAVLNLRLETCQIATGRNDSSAGIEILAFGTAVRRGP